MVSFHGQKWSRLLDDQRISDVGEADNALFCNNQEATDEATECSIQSDYCKENIVNLKRVSSRRRCRGKSCSVPGYKAYKEKMRRDRLNDKFFELGSISEPGSSPKTDKVTILIDAIRVLKQLRTEVQQLRESNHQLQESIKNLKAEKNELRDEKLRWKAEKEKLEQQMKLIIIPGYVSHPEVFHHVMAAYAAQNQTAGSKAPLLPGFPGFTMWQWMPPAVLDTSQDHVLRPPVA